MHTREKIIGDCIKSDYIRYRKKMPETKILEAEIKFAVKDLYDIPTDQIKEAFAYANRQHEKDRPPLAKEVLARWKAKQAGRESYQVRGCENCTAGFISAHRKTQSFNIKGETIIYDKPYTFRCTCAAGQQLSQRIIVWDNQSGYVKL